MEDGPSKRPADEVSPDAAGNEDKKGDDIVEKDAIMIDETTPSSVAAETPMAEPVEIRSSNPVPEPVTKSGNLPSRPIKKARTAYFIFADEKRPEIQARVRLYHFIKSDRKHEEYDLRHHSLLNFIILITPYHSILVKALEVLPAKLANFGQNSMRLAGPSITSNRPGNESVSHKNWPSTP